MTEYDHTRVKVLPSRQGIAAHFTCRHALTVAGRQAIAEHASTTSRNASMSPYRESEYKTGRKRESAPMT